MLFVPLFIVYFTKLYGEPHMPTVIAGDFNETLGPFVDISQPQGHKQMKIKMALELLIKDLGLCFILWFIHPVYGDYSYFSPVHGPPANTLMLSSGHAVSHGNQTGKGLGFYDILRSNQVCQRLSWL
uniref:Endonuclease/exonuclease/phosphatase domain-containing protein n=1 Tax=Chelonoidis abingdonii TaxID=106734 RepID=A0A8C0ILN8_CHEAB